MSRSGDLLVRVDANSEIGAGHFMRCFALAQAWKDEVGRVRFLSAILADGLRERLVEEGMELLDMRADPGSSADAKITVRAAGASNPRWIVIDGWKFGPEFQRTVAASGRKILAIDDFGRADSGFADLILDQNFAADASKYPLRQPSGRLLLGSEFVLLRREFADVSRKPRSFSAAANKILVSFGGADPANAMPSLIRALERINVPDLEIIILAGIVNRSIGEVRAVAGRSPLSISFHDYVPDILPMMKWAELGVIMGGGTLWECMAAGLPVASFSLDRNQSTILDHLADAGYISSLGPISNIESGTCDEVLEDFVMDQNRRTAMSRAGRELVDGKGAQRVVSAMKTSEDD
jgi:UDP-2,4-diacetamido-2,4,6-trideoxy-beta-L-altropyranose hydrolase